MTIQFNCPNCGELIAFADKHRGKRAHCATCGQRFVIPLAGDKAAKKIKPSKEEKEQAVPIPGFYRAVFIESWKLFTNPKNAPDFAFILVLVVFKFFTAHLNFKFFIQGQWLAFDFYIPLGWVLSGAAWAGLFWFYTEVIYSVGFDQDELPTVTIGGFYGLIWKILKSLYAMAIILLVVGLPYIVASLVLKWMRAESSMLLSALGLGGLFLLPMAILTVAVGKDLTMLRPDYLLVPICRAFRPYLVLVVWLGVAVGLQTYAKQYARQDVKTETVFLLMNVAVQMLVLIAMRSIGLFYRHYSCYLSW
jgi:hypothetical protein